MEKVRLQVLVDSQTYAFLNGFCIEFRCKNMSEAIRKLVENNKRLRGVIENLERVAWEQTNIDRPPVQVDNIQISEKPFKITNNHPNQSSIKGIKEEKPRPERPGKPIREVKK